MKASINYNEDARIDSLKKYEILDTSAEAVYDDLATLAASICGAPLAAISFVDEQRIWFKSRIGLEYRELDRDDFFCAHAILRPEQTLVVPDGFTDPRFSDNDLVRGRSQFRFYAGAPLLTPDGYPIGTICVLDHLPKALSSSQVDALRILSRQVVTLLELRRANVLMREQQECLMRTKEEATIAGRAKATFLANISHEIRTPMNGVVGVTSLLSATPLSERQKHYVDTIEKSAEGLLHVLSNILDFSKNEMGTSVADSAPIDLPAFIDDIADMMRPMSISKQLKFIASVDDEVRQTLIGDPQRLQQVVTNLVGNAFKFTTQGTVELSVGQVSETSRSKVVRFQIRDTGIGISKDRQKMIFDEFVQVDAGTERKFGGTGLGLSICRQLAKVIGTKIELTSEIGIGSTFWFDLEMPIHVIELKLPNLPRAYADEPYRRHPRVLVAEDNEVNSLVVTSMLEHNGCEVVSVGSGSDAVRAIESQSFDLVFMDVQMPNMDGIEATKAIRSLAGPSKEVPIIALTASVLREDAMTCKLAGMNDFISKPINEKVISEALKRWVSRMDAAVGA